MVPNAFRFGVFLRFLQRRSRIGRLLLQGQVLLFPPLHFARSMRLLDHPVLHLPLANTYL